VLTFRGQTFYRRQGFVRAAQLTCPLGHRIAKRAIIREDGALWCAYRQTSAEEECGAIVYVLAFPGLGHGLGHRHRFWVADVTMADLDLMEELRMAVDDVLSYFNATLPPAAPLRLAHPPP
jgi:hypothetical protein